jgi:mRNA interferase RelE/StbE
VRLEFAQSAHKDLKKLGQGTQKQVLKKLKFLIEQPDPLKYAVKLTNFTGGSWRFRVGQYRVIFDVKGDTIYVLQIEHRREVYRR